MMLFAALTSGYKEQIELLEEIAASEESRAEVKSDATGGWGQPVMRVGNVETS